ncbi:unnamed protein product [Darwinula stevensoni]|uniref:Uncharacterized protein n=1 Tax=Darwinula stevensoni TaxID=69355 RepID=A0A7R8X4Y1_9CRUS|nr:unnamed protein product [Darwinula stevensoni]CAG0886538.1 unnamed protein product [Darwinula stevensoni]
MYEADWNCFQLTLDTCLPDSLSISSTDDVSEATQVITEAIQMAQDDAIPILTAKTSRPYSISQTTLSLIKEVRATRSWICHMPTPVTQAPLSLSQGVVLQTRCHFGQPGGPELHHNEHLTRRQSASKPTPEANKTTTIEQDRPSISNQESQP